MSKRILPKFTFNFKDVLENENTAKTASLVFLFQLIVAVGVMYYILNAAKNELDKHLINKITNKSITNESINEAETHAQNENFLNICTSNLKDCNCENCELVKVTVK
jgi:hypothetical protein